MFLTDENGCSWTNFILYFNHYTQNAMSRLHVAPTRVYKLPSLHTQECFQGFRVQFLVRCSPANLQKLLQ